MSEEQFPVRRIEALRRFLKVCLEHRSLELEDAIRVCDLACEALEARNCERDRILRITDHWARIWADQDTEAGRAGLAATACIAGDIRRGRDYPADPATQKDKTRPGSDDLSH